MVETKEILQCFMKEPDSFANTIDSLLRSELLQSQDKNVLFAIKRNIEFGMVSEDVRKRLLEVANNSPQLVALLIAFSVYRFYTKN